METATADSDMGVGVAVVCSVLALGGALVMLVGDQPTAAWGFAAAMTAAAFAVVGAQAYW